jgi:hypothetical protein
MPQAASTEFWKDLKPIQKVFQLDALPEVYTHDAPNGDERLFVPFTDTVSSKPLWISPGQNKSASRPGTLTCTITSSCAGRITRRWGWARTT